MNTEYNRGRLRRSISDKASENQSDVCCDVVNYANSNGSRSSIYINKLASINLYDQRQVCKNNEAFALFYSRLMSNNWSRFAKVSEYCTLTFCCGTRSIGLIGDSYYASNLVFDSMSNLLYLILFDKFFNL